METELMDDDGSPVQNDDLLGGTGNGATIFKNNPNIHSVVADVEAPESQNSKVIDVRVTPGKDSLPSENVSVTTM